MTAQGSLTYCTYFDSRYLPRGLALIQSLERFAPESRVIVMALDKETSDALHKMAPRVKAFPLEDLEAFFPRLQSARQNRSHVEYLFTLTPHLPLYLRSVDQTIDRIAYIDADVWFFSSPSLLDAEVSDSEIAIIPHRFPRRLAFKNRYGRFNVGWLSFADSTEATRCLEWWAEKCIEWCRTTLKGDRYADQKYLDSWPDLFQDVVVVKHAGANLAPWNVDNHRLEVQHDSVVVDESPLIFFHFHSLSRIARGLYNPHFEKYLTVPGSVVRRRVYRPYLRSLEENYSALGMRKFDRSFKDVASFQLIRAGRP